jgi:hypothetical protein
MGTGTGRAFARFVMVLKLDNYVKRNDAVTDIK